MTVERVAMKTQQQAQDPREFTQMGDPDQAQATEIEVRLRIEMGRSISHREAEYRQMLEDRPGDEEVLNALAMIEEARRAGSEA